jgi:hypothetical protein
MYGPRRAILALSGDLAAIVILASLSAAGVGALLATNAGLFTARRDRFRARRPGRSEMGPVGEVQNVRFRQSELKADRSSPLRPDASSQIIEICTTLGWWEDQRT